METSGGKKRKKQGQGIEAKKEREREEKSSVGREKFETDDGNGIECWVDD